MCSSVFLQTKTPKCNLSGKHNCDVMRYQIEVIRLVLLLHIHANLGIMLARDYASWHVARSTLVMLVANTQMACKKSGFKSYRPLDRPFKGQGCAQPLQLNFRELKRVIHQMCAAIPQQYIHRHMLSTSTRFIDIDATPGGCTKYWNEIKYGVLWFCSFCFKVFMFTLNFKCVPVIKFQWFFVLYVRNKLYLTCTWLLVFFSEYFS